MTQPSSSDATADGATAASTAPASTTWWNAALAPFRTRIGRIISGFVILIIGIVLIPLPVVGPAWILIILGLSILPFAWTVRAIAFLRRHLPGIPETGKLPLRTWIILGVMVTAFVAVGIIWGPKMADWVKHLF